MTQFGQFFSPETEFVELVFDGIEEDKTSNNSLNGTNETILHSITYKYVLRVKMTTKAKFLAIKSYLEAIVAGGNNKVAIDTEALECYYMGTPATNTQFSFDLKDLKSKEKSIRFDVELPLKEVKYY